MSQYYLMSQLPALDGLGESAPMPITEERFYELCERFLPSKTYLALKGLNLVPPKSTEKTGFSFVDSWNEKERALRFALAFARAEKWGKPKTDTDVYIPSEFAAAAKEAVEIENPLEAENFLNNFRIKVLDGLRPMDAFCLDAVFYYAVRLKLTARIRLFDGEKGQKAYKDIYNTIMDKDRQEAKQ